MLCAWIWKKDECQEEKKRRSISDSYTILTTHSYTILTNHSYTILTTHSCTIFRDVMETYRERASKLFDTLMDDVRRNAVYSLFVYKPAAPVQP